MALLLLLRNQAGTLVRGAPGVTSAEAFGTPKLLLDKFVRPGHILSQEAFGIPRLLGVTSNVVRPIGITSELAFGRPIFPADEGELLLSEAAALEIRVEELYAIYPAIRVVNRAEVPETPATLYSVAVSVSSEQED